MNSSLYWYKQPFLMTLSMSELKNQNQVNKHFILALYSQKTKFAKDLGKKIIEDIIVVLIKVNIL